MRTTSHSGAHQLGSALDDALGAAPELGGSAAQDLDALVSFIGDARAVLAAGSRPSITALAARLSVAAALARSRAHDDAQAKWALSRLVRDHLAELDALVADARRERAMGLGDPEDNFALDDVLDIPATLAPMGEDLGVVSSTLLELAAVVVDHARGPADIDRLLAATAAIDEVVDYARATEARDVFDGDFWAGHPGALAQHLIGCVQRIVGGASDLFVPDGEHPASYLWAQSAIAAARMSSIDLPGRPGPPANVVWAAAAGKATGLLAASDLLERPGDFDAEVFAGRIVARAVGMSFAWLDALAGARGERLRDEADHDSLRALAAYALIGCWASRALHTPPAQHG